MKLAEAIANDLPFELLLGDSERPLPVGWLWELRQGGIAYCFLGYGSSPSAESHLHRGTVEGEGPWRLLDRDRKDRNGTPLRVTIRVARAHRYPEERGSEAAALRYFRFWHDRLPKDAVLGGTREPPPESPHNRRTRA